MFTPGDMIGEIALACDDLKIEQRYVVYPGSERFHLRHGAQAIGLRALTA